MIRFEVLPQLALATITERKVFQLFHNDDYHGTISLSLSFSLMVVVDPDMIRSISHNPQYSKNLRVDGLTGDTGNTP